MEKYHITEVAARVVAPILKNGRGVHVWKSQLIGGGGPESWLTPGDATTRPHWSTGKTPDLTFKEVDDFVVDVASEFKRFRVALKRGSGMSVNITDHSKKKMDKYLAEAGDTSWHEFDYAAQEAVIMKVEKSIPLSEWIANHPEVTNG